MDKQRNLIMAVLLTILLIFGWEAAMKHFYPDADKKPAAAHSAAAKSDPAQAAKPTREGGLMDPADQALEARETKLRESERAASVELMHKSVLGKAPFERVEAFFAALGKLGLDEAEKRLRAS